MNSLDRHNEVQDEYWEEDVEAYNNDSLSLPTLRLVWISEHDKQVRGGPAPADPADWRAFMRKQGAGKRPPDMVILTCMGFTKEIYDEAEGFEKLMSIAAGLEVKDMPGARYSLMSLMNLSGEARVKRSLSLYEDKHGLDIENTIDSANTKAGVPVSGLLIGA